jgi:predicted TPR repeat methyltransferase
LYQRALELNPQNAMAEHALSALEGRQVEHASKEYLAGLFDSYSATFDESLASLGYSSPELLR